MWIWLKMHVRSVHKEHGTLQLQIFIGTQPFFISLGFLCRPMPWRYYFVKRNDSTGLYAARDAGSWLS